MIIRTEPESDIPLYLQISNQIMEGIAKGTLLAGQSLPSVRVFAADIGVNMHTVNKSYHHLEKKGLIKITPKSGAIISPPQELEPSSLIRLKDEFRPLIAESVVLGMSKEQIQELVTSLYDDFHKLR